MSIAREARLGHPEPASGLVRAFMKLVTNIGAALAELVAATKWGLHIARAALIRLNKQGNAVTRKKVGGGRYRIVKVPAQ